MKFPELKYNKKIMKVIAMKRLLLLKIRSRKEIRIGKESDIQLMLDKSGMSILI